MDGTGNVGIGTTGPGKVLAILHASENELLRVRRGSGASYQSASFGVDTLGANYGAAIWHGTEARHYTTGNFLRYRFSSWELCGGRETTRQREEQ